MKCTPPPDESEPAYLIYSVHPLEDDDKATSWFMIGAAWPSNDGLGLVLEFDAMPLPYAQVVLRTPDDILARTEGDQTKSS